MMLLRKRQLFPIWLTSLMLILMTGLSASPLAAEEDAIGLVAASSQALPSLKNESTVDLGGGVNLEMVLIRPGQFKMGSESGESHEKPVHEVRIEKPFYLGKYEVTQGQWEAVMGNNPSNFKGDKNLPVENVSWEDCQEFLKKLSAKEDKPYRLPSEAEWEYACRAGSTTEYCFGNLVSGLGEYAWYKSNSESKNHPVGKKKPNVWGLYDMHGNVWEWCEDWYQSDFYSQSPATVPNLLCTNPTSGLRVIRGGLWSYWFGGYCRSAVRGCHAQASGTTA